MKKFKLLVFIGRFQPFHMGHKKVIDEALQLSEKVLVLVGSAYSPRTLRNPFTYEERVDFVSNSFTKEERDKIIFRPVGDKTYNNQAWINQVQNIVSEEHKNIGKSSKDKVGLIGYAKDNTSFYLKLFPQYESVSVGSYMDISATRVRLIMYNDSQLYYSMVDNILPKAVADFCYNSDAGKSIISDMRVKHEFNVKHNKSWENSPYEPTFNTVDALVEQSGHILLIRRRSEPGKGLWAMPGGYINIDETLQQSMIRELREETKLKIPDKVLNGSIINKFDADDPFRSDRGRVISKVFHIKLQDSIDLPKIKGSDDADKAIWLPISELKEEEMFEDHFHIICKLLGI